MKTIAQMKEQISRINNYANSCKDLDMINKLYDERCELENAIIEMNVKRLNISVDFSKINDEICNLMSKINRLEKENRDVTFSDTINHQYYSNEVYRQKLKIKRKLKRYNAILDGTNIMLRFFLK